MSEKTKNYFTKKMKNILALPKEKFIQIRKKQIKNKTKNRTNNKYFYSSYDYE